MINLPNLPPSERGKSGFKPNPPSTPPRGYAEVLVNSLVVKLASIAVHAEEMISPLGHEFDRQAIVGLLQDTEIRAFLDDPKNAVFLPLKRGGCK